MPAKTEFYVQLAERTAKHLTDSTETWTSFLTTSARLYKYPFPDQLMIYAQRPDATACASYGTWNYLRKHGLLAYDELKQKFAYATPGIMRCLSRSNPRKKRLTSQV
ncbi:MAG: hypothetical protein IKI93_06070 [Clostridia bacterium]|nr:hypothetical protein [Clostridia bacterium]